MKLIIKQINKDEENKQIKVTFQKHELIISKESEKWNNEGINEFLINIATTLPEDEQHIEVEFDKESTDQIYKHVCNLFVNFADEFNQQIKNLKK